MSRYLALAGPNTNQVWVYDEELDVYIDPPISVLKEIDSYASNYENYLEVSTNKLQEIVDAECPPDWLYDKEYHYGNIEI